MIKHYLRILTFQMFPAPLIQGRSLLKEMFLLTLLTLQTWGNEMASKTAQGGILRLILMLRL